VMTGPVLAHDDPVWERFPEIQYPRMFWKLAVARTVDGRPFAVAFVLDQSEAVDSYGIEAAEVPFGGFKTFQVPVKEVERLTSLRFSARIDGRNRHLSAFDPLAREAAIADARNRVLGPESAAVSAGALPESYVPLWSVRAIIR